MKSNDSTSSSEPKHASGAEEHNDELDWWQFCLLHKGEKQNALSWFFWSWSSLQYFAQESWVNAMRSFENGTLKMEGSQEKGMPPLNSMRVPMENAPAPHLLTQLNPERMYLLGDPRYLWQENFNYRIWCPGASFCLIQDQPKPGLPCDGDPFLPVAQLSGSQE